MDKPTSGRACILASCQDRPGIVAGVSSYLYEHGANIVQLDQHTSNPNGGTYFMRVEFDAPPAALEAVASGFSRVAQRFGMSWRIAFAHQKKRAAIFVSKEDHCLLELLWQWRWGTLDLHLNCVISNHELLRETVESFGLPFYHIPVSPETKPQAEAEALAILGEETDLIILARYMQILSPQFVARFPNRIINIHHSFLPAFVGSRPYDQAFARGVKIIGATAHYVTAELDAGPIIEQDVVRVSHRNSVEELKSLGRTIERTVLARAVKWHVEDRILVHENKTVVFGTA